METLAIPDFLHPTFLPRFPRQKVEATSKSTHHPFSSDKFKVVFPSTCTGSHVAEPFLLHRQLSFCLASGEHGNSLSIVFTEDILFIGNARWFFRAKYLRVLEECSRGISENGGRYALYEGEVKIVKRVIVGPLSACVGRSMSGNTASIAEEEK